LQLHERSVVAFGTRRGLAQHASKRISSFPSAGIPRANARPMKMKLLAISVAAAAALVVPTTVRADDDVDKAKDKAQDKVQKAEDKLAEANRKTHEKICQGHHGTVTAKSDNSITIDGKRYAYTADTKVNKQEEALISKTVKSGDHVCFTTEKAADGSDQVAQVIMVDKDEKVRVRDKDADYPKKVDETPDKKDDVK
jgi:hypothetical protein